MITLTHGLTKANLQLRKSAGHAYRTSKSTRYPILTASVTAQRTGSLLDIGMFPAPPWTIMHGLNGILVSAITKDIQISKPEKCEWSAPICDVRSSGPRDITRGLTPSTKHHIFPTSNMADDLVQAGEQEIQEYFDAAVNVAKQAGQVIKWHAFAYFLLLFCSLKMYN